MIPRFSPDYRWTDFLQCFMPVKKNAVEKLEQEFALKAKHDNAISFRYGRTGLYYLLKALGHKNKKIIMPSYSCVVVAHAIVMSGNIPVFLDSADKSFQPLPSAYITAIEENIEDAVMIIPTHLFGIVEETQELYETVKNKYPHIFILQDCAHGYFCQDSGQEVVTSWGDAALFGMNISKLVNSVKGGMLTLKDAELANEIRKLSAKDEIKTKNSLVSRLYVLAVFFAFMPMFYSLVYWLQRKTNILSSETKYYQDDVIELPKDFKLKMNSFEASIGLSSLARYEQRVKNRQTIANIYTDLLRPYKEKGLLQYAEPQAGYTWSHFPVVINDLKNRDKIINALEQNHGMEIGLIVDYSIADMEAYKKRGHLTCLNAKHTSEHIINLPLCLKEHKCFPTFLSSDTKIKEITCCFKEI